MLLDCNDLAEGHDFFSLGAFSVSLDEATLAYATDVVGDERYTIRVLRLDSNEHLPDTILLLTQRACIQAIFHCPAQCEHADYEDRQAKEDLVERKAERTLISWHNEQSPDAR